MGFREEEKEEKRKMTILTSKKGIAFVWLGILILIIIIGIFFVMLNKPVEKVKEITKKNVTGTQYEKSYNQQNTLWDYFLLFFIFGMFLFGISEAIKRPQ